MHNFFIYFTAYAKKIQWFLKIEGTQTWKYVVGITVC